MKQTAGKRNITTFSVQVHYKQTVSTIIYELVSQNQFLYDFLLEWPTHSKWCQVKNKSYGIIFSRPISSSWQGSLI